MREPVPLRRRIPHSRLLAFTLVLSPAFVWRFNAWPIDRQRAIVAEFSAAPTTHSLSYACTSGRRIGGVTIA